MENFKMMCKYKNLPISTYFSKNRNSFLVSQQKKKKKKKNPTFLNIIPRANTYLIVLN